MIRDYVPPLVLILLTAPTALATNKKDVPQKPNVLFIAVDDLNHWVGHLKRNPQTRTPNIDRLAAMGVTFTRAYCAAPVCNPSRAALMSGLRPSLRDLLADPQAAWDRSALTTYHRGNHSLRSERWRYIRYVDGGEELYDHDADDYEWTNLAADANYASVKADLGQWLPKVNHAELPSAGQTKRQRQRQRALAKGGR